MILLAIVTILCLWTATVCAQLPNQYGQVWREYDTVAMPPPNVQTLHGDAPAESPIPSPSIMEIVKRETGEVAWSGPGFGLIGTDGHKLFVYNTPAVQQRVAETISRFQRPETKGVRFVMTTNFLTVGGSFYERWGDFTPQLLAEFPPHVQEAMALKTTAYFDARTPVLKYLHPILGPDGKSPCQQPGVSAYWVAKDDVPKVQEIWNTLFQAAMGDVRSQISGNPEVVTFNGQLGAVVNTTSQQFATNVVYIPTENEVRPIQTDFKSGSSTAMFSLLSWDGRTVSSDVHYEASMVRSLRNLAQQEEPWLEVPNIESLMISEKGLVWPADGMLIVFIGGIRRLSEARVEVGTPVLNKVPVIGRHFTKTAYGRDVTTVNGILTVRMLPPNEQR